MELGIYTFAELTPDPSTGRTISPAERLRNLVEEMELADQVGLDVFGVGEHHRPDFAVSTPGGRARRRRRADEPDPAHECRERDQLGRPRARLPGLRHARPALGRARRDHGRPRVVHRVVPALRLRPRRLRRALRGEAPAAARPSRVGARHLVGPPPAAARRPRRLPEAAPGSAPDLGGGRRRARVGGARRGARPADGARDHRRPARALRAVRGDPPRGRAPRRPRPRLGAAQHQLPRLRRRDLAGRRGRCVPAVPPPDDEDRQASAVGRR